MVKKDIEMYYIRTDTVQFSGWISLLYAAGTLCCSTEVVFAAAPASWVSAATLHVLSEPVASDQQLEDPGSNPRWISMSFFLPTNNSTINTSPYNFSLRQAKHFEQLSFGRSSGTLEQRIDGKGCFFSRGRNVSSQPLTDFWQHMQSGSWYLVHWTTAKSTLALNTVSASALTMQSKAYHKEDPA